MFTNIESYTYNHCQVIFPLFLFNNSLTLIKVILKNYAGNLDNDTEIYLKPGAPIKSWTREDSGQSPQAANLIILLFLTTVMFHPSLSILHLFILRDISPLFIHYQPFKKSLNLILKSNNLKNPTCRKWSFQFSKTTDLLKLPMNLPNPDRPSLRDRSFF